MRVIKLTFTNIPVDTGFSVFDKKDKKKSQAGRADIGDSQHVIEVSDAWSEPFMSLACSGGYVLIGPTSYRPIQEDEQAIEVTGAEYYADVDREVGEEELNASAVETLIHANSGLTGRQKFYVSLVALQSHFEYLVYGMLVLSGHWSKTRFNQEEETHESRTVEAFSEENAEFFAAEIVIKGDRPVPQSDIAQEVIDQTENIFNQIRTLRNNVVHNWSSRAGNREELQAIFNSIGETLYAHQPDDDTFYNDAAHLLVRLYARTNVINGRVKIFKEKAVVAEEREARGY